MNAPLVVVQGDLLLPTMYPLAGMPNAAYGEEWTLSRARPALTEYEIPFYAARFFTAYVSPHSPRNERFPYTPTSLWGKFRRSDDTLAAGQDTPAAAPEHVAEPAAEPASFAFEPFNAPDDRLVKTPPANDHRKQIAGGAIALACAGFIAWTLFGTRMGHLNPEQPAAPALNAMPAAKSGPDAPVAVAAVVPPVVNPSVTPAVTPVISPTASSAAAAVVANASTAAAAAAAAAPAQPSPAKAQVEVASNETAKPSANTASVAGNHAPERTAAALTAHASKPAVIARTKPRLVAQAAERDRAKLHMKSKRIALANREARGYEVAQRRKSHEYLGTPVYRSSGFDAPLASPARRIRPHDDMRTASSGSSLSVAEMYSMLAHSAVLDDNSGAARQTVRATSRSNSGDSSNWSSDLSQRRVTDPGSQFLK